MRAAAVCKVTTPFALASIHPSGYPPPAAPSETAAAAAEIPIIGNDVTPSGITKATTKAAATVQQAFAVTTTPGREEEEGEKL